MKTLTNKMVCFALLLIAFFSCGKKVSKETEMAQNRIVVDALEKGIIQSTVSKLNARCPIVLDFIVTLDKADFEAPKTIVYYYTANLKEPISESQGVKENIRTNLDYEVYYGEKFNYLKDIGTTFKFVYKTQDGDFFMRHIIGPDDYMKLDSTSHNSTLTDEECYRLLKETEEMSNKQLPYTANNIEIGKVEAIAPRTIKYYYRLLNIEKKDITDEVINESKANLLNGIKSKKDEDKILKDNDVIFEFSYYDKNNTPIYSLTLTPEEYK